MDPCSNDPPSPLALLEARCHDLLLDIELDLDNSSLTFQAVQWALSSLLAIQDAESLVQNEAILSILDNSQILNSNSIFESRLSHVSAIEQAEVDAEIHTGCRQPISRFDINENPYESDRTVSEDDVENEEINTLRQVEESAQWSTGRRDGDLDKADELKETGESMETSGECDDGIGLDEDIKIADRGEAGERMAALIRERLVVPGCSSLVNLIKRCLLLSLDQETLEQATPITLGLRQPDDERAWLHGWLLQHLRSSSKQSDYGKKQRGSKSGDLDWLVACLSAASPDLFLILLLDNIVADCLNDRAKGHVPLLPFVRTAAILEFVFLRIGEHAATIIISSYQPSVQLSSASKEEHLCKFSDLSMAWGRCLTNSWLVLGSLCPGLFGGCICLLVPTLPVASINKWWTLLQSWNSGELPLLGLSKVLVDTRFDEPKSLKDWFCVILRRRLPQLAPVAADVVLLLNQLCKLSVDQVDKELAEAAYLLLEDISQEVCQCALLQISGLRAAEGNNTVSSFMENLKIYVMRLWCGVLCSSSTFERCCSNTWLLASKISSESGSSVLPEVDRQTGEFKNRQGPYENMRSVYEHPSVQICFSTILCCDERVVAELLVDSTTLAHSAADEDDSLTKLLLVISVMRILAAKAQSHLIFELWAQSLINRVHTLNNDQASTRIFAVKKLLDLSFEQSYDFTSSFPTRFEKAGHESDCTSWVPVRHHLKVALSHQWLPLLSLLHRDDAWELRLTVLGILQLLPPDKSSHHQEVTRRLKGALGLYLWWLDKAYGYVNLNEHCGERRMCLLTNWTNSDDKWQIVRLIEQIKEVIIQLASSRIMSFTLMANSLLDYSFQGMHRPLTEATPTRKTNKSFPFLATWNFGRLNRYGRFVIVSRQESRYFDSKIPLAVRSLPENLKIQKIENHRNGSKYPSSQSRTVGLDIVGSFTPDSLIAAQLGNLLRRTLEQASTQTEESSGKDAFPSHPSSVISTLLVDRLQTPHEIPMTKEQYEEVLPKPISSSRHIFLMDCFHRNPFLFEMLEIIVEKGGHSEVLQCVEFLRALLADSISYWHGTNRTHKLHTSLALQVSNGEEADRVQVCRLIQMISMTSWLPQPLASSSEIVSLLDSADMSDLLLLVWHCMHYDQQPNTKSTSTVRAGTPAAGQEGGVHKDWEGQYFTILRKNVARIGAHFSQLYPKQRVL